MQKTVSFKEIELELTMMELLLEISQHAALYDGEELAYGIDGERVSFLIYYEESSDISYLFTYNFEINEGVFYENIIEYFSERVVDGIEEELFCIGEIYQEY